MMSPKRASLTESELEVLKVLWEHGAATVRATNEVLSQRGRQWAYTTVLTLLGRLESKGFVASDKSELAFVFRPLVSREKLLRQRLTRLVDELCEGTTTPLVQALVQGQKFSPDEIEQFRHLLDELEGKQPADEPVRPKRDREN